MKLTLKMRRLVHSFTFQVRAGMAEVQTRILRGYPLVTKWNVVRGLTVGFLLSVGVGMYFNLASEGAAITPAAQQNREATPVSVASTYRGSPIDDDEWRFGPPYIEDFRSASVPPTSGKGLLVYPGDDEWVYGPPYLEVFPQDDPYAHLTVEQFHRQVK